MAEEPDKDMLEDEAPGATDLDVILHEIETANQTFTGWFDRGDSVVSLYRGEGDKVNDASDRFNILWSNTETQRPFLYSQTPKPIVRRRFLEPDQAAQVASELLERCIDYSMECEGHEFSSAMSAAVDDYLLPGRGVVRVVYDATFEEMTTGFDEDGEEITEEKKASEEVYAEYVYWKDFLHSYARCWDEVWWVAFGTYMTKRDLKEQFGAKVADKVPLISELLTEDSSDTTAYRKGYDRKDCARVWEFWNKNTKKVYKVAEGYDEYLEEPVDDPLSLERFFPCTEPLYMIKTTASLEPVPEYKMYETQAAEVNTLTARINNLTTAMRVVGAYDAGLSQEIGRLVRGTENSLVPIENFTSYQQAGGANGAIEWLPIAQIAEVLVRLVEQRQLNLQTIYEITGIVDIIRGVAVPRETKAAAEARASYATGRLGEKQRKVEKFAQQTLSLMGEVIAEQFDEKTMFMVTGVQPDDPQKVAGMQEAVKILRDDLVRGFKIEIETDSTIAPDSEREKQELMEFLNGISGFIQAAASGMQTGMMTPEIAKEIVLFAARRFRTGRQLEDTLSQMGSQPPPPQQDPNAAADQMKMQIEQQKLKLERMRIEGEQALEAQKLMLEQAKLMQSGQIEEKKIQQKHIEALINRDTARINASGGNEKAN